MRLALFRPLWGVIEAFDGQRSLKDALRAIKALGYEGVEVPFKAVYMIGPDKFQRLLRDSDLKVGFQVFSDGPLAPGVKGLAGGPYPGHPAEGESPQDHFEVFKAQVLAAREFEPAFVNSHSGKDYFTHSQALEFFAKAIHLEREEIGYDFVVTHETHRKRFFYSPWVCRDFLPTVPDLRLCADFSHFINVTEGMPDDKHLTEVITNLAPQVRHIHARVGYSHGPQVSDPRAPEWMPFTEGHEKW
ncbi:hypothetical protein PTSG_08088 [Salpingoeca rosetta]|uniref:Xylose isomerase-like TIM barrel domain-containing protein n=1 Tax=Salpingoeca rosetta (strain ATCC 50818 / BSB-021) TaxID=946362 RepID=F2UHY8_SALR5|nr:uncharacterized protein PTSG_08088 [Salpingoeca rosetta]EGD76737.1 hypothetical protein PTSG_08088 [Salpingoeca rosetta]|eukprot:XP_004991109.1 hypothetical protein PTSG_08088 [Salpingoeca rosetta]